NLNDLLYLSLTPAYWESGVYIEQTANIDASDTQVWNAGKGFSPIGLNSNFQGTYNGKGYTISNLYINRPDTNDIGLFGNIVSANISNVGLVNAQIVGKEYVGGLVSTSDSSTISNTYVTGSVNAGSGTIGGLVGFASESTMSNSYVTCSVSGTGSVGGLIGVAWETNISNSYAIGLVSGSEAVGGLIGEEESNTVLNSFWDTQTTEQAFSAGGTGKTTAEMKDINTYLMAGWDFAQETDNGTEDIWVYYNDYPHLSWEGELISEFIVNQRVVSLGNSIDFTNLAIGATDYLWEFGDGNSSTEESPLHTYEQIGTYTVSLTCLSTLGSVTKIRENYVIITPVTVEPLIGSLFISEVSAGKSTTTQYIELYNNSDDHLSIKNIRLTMDGITDFNLGNFDSYSEDIIILPDNFLVISRGADRVAFESEFNALPEGVTFLQGDTDMLFGEGEGHQWQLILDTGSKEVITIDDTLIPVGGENQTSYPSTFGGEWVTESSENSTPGTPHESQTLPVTLASFMAIQTANNLAQISWVTASETNLLGYNIYRAEADNPNEAVRITFNMIDAINSAFGASYSYLDEKVESGATYYYWLETNDFDGTSAMVGPVTIKISSDGEDHDIEEILLGTQLFANYPNPFNPSTTISFSVAEPQVVTIDVYNLRGQLVKRVFDKKVDEVNSKHSIVWNGQDSDGHSVASGIYFTIMKAGTKRFSNKAILMK
ncbi:MAG: PKD domain-containing protein, partial [Candidatus Cloacimonadales bacterium]